MKILLVSCGDVATEAGLRWATAGHQVTAWRRRAERLPTEFVGHGVDLLDSSDWPAIDPQTEVVVLTPVPVTRDVDGYDRSYRQVAERLVDRLHAEAPALQRLIYVSSSAVLGGSGGEWVSELSATAPSRPTARVLAKTEQLLLDSGLPLSILRASGIYGPGRSRLIDLVRTGQAQLPPDSHWTNRIHRDDLARAMVHIAELGAAADALYLASDNEPVQLAEVYRFLADELGCPVPPETNEAPARRAADRRLSNARLRNSGFEFNYPGYREGYRAILSGQSTRHR